MVSTCLLFCRLCFWYVSCLLFLVSLPLCVSVCFVLLSRRVAFQERRVTMRVPISFVVLPQAAVAPPLAELTAQLTTHSPIYL